MKPDGTPEMEEVEYTIPRFRVTTVFDVSQTEGEPLPELETPELRAVWRIMKYLCRQSDISPVPIRFDEIESGAKGYYSSVDKEIVIQESMSESQTMKTGIHEVTHAKLHDRDIMEKMDEKKDQMTREVEAESVAYTVCRYFGLDTSDYSFPYIAGWSSDKDMKELRSSMDTIRRVSGEFIDQMMNRCRQSGGKRSGIRRTPCLKNRRTDMGFTSFVRTVTELPTVLWEWRTCRQKEWRWMALIISLFTEMSCRKEIHWKPYIQNLIWIIRQIIRGIPCR